MTPLVGPWGGFRAGSPSSASCTRRSGEAVLAPWPSKSGRSARSGMPTRKSPSSASVSPYGKHSTRWTFLQRVTGCRFTLDKESPGGYIVSMKNGTSKAATKAAGFSTADLDWFLARAEQSAQPAVMVDRWLTVPTSEWVAALIAEKARRVANRVAAQAQSDAQAASLAPLKGFKVVR
jgi:hypothetical protein